MPVASASIQQARRSIVAGLRAIGLAEGDVAAVHSDTAPAMHLGDPDARPGRAWLEAAVDRLRDCFLEVIGDGGTLLAPTFNYGFCRGATYVHEETPSEVGLFGERLRLDPVSRRSFHPIFSFAAVGAEADALCADVPPTSFGPGSVFARLRERNAWLVFFNTSFEHCTFVHHVEQERGVPYRWLKTFRGTVERDGRTREAEFDYLVRPLDGTVNASFARLGDALLAEGAMRRAEIGPGSDPVLMVRAQDVARVAGALLDEDPFALLAAPPPGEAGP